MTPLHQSTNRLRKLPLRLHAGVWRHPMKLRELLALKPGYILKTDVSSGDRAGLYLGNIAVASGEIAVSNDRLQYRVSELADKE